ncbi:response regulator transcription factor [Candidatus Saccharibacteria bacterium]|nr:MAG: response regulator transcription factor [Candidatus Saccharibacteria bacterium]
MRLLLVEDEPKIARAIKMGLEQERSTVEVYHDGPSGLAAALGDDYDAIILDRMLPGGMDGLEICEKIRENSVKTPVLMLTAKGQVRDRVNGLNAGADDYLVKPFSFEELLARLRALTRRPHEVKSTMLTAGDLSLDPVTYDVRRAGKPIALSQTEYSLLEYLLRNKDRVLSKDNIINHVWDFDADILPNTVEAYIGYLRNKIDKPYPKRPRIHTVRGFGYKLGKLTKNEALISLGHLTSDGMVHTHSPPH